MKKNSENRRKPAKKDKPEGRTTVPVKWHGVTVPPWHGRAFPPVRCSLGFLFKACSGVFAGDRSGVARGLTWTSLWRFLG